MQISITKDKNELGQQSALKAAAVIRKAIAERGEANIIIATGASQFEMLQNLVQAEDIDRSVVTGFHLDEYVGMPTSHNASFQKYLKERFVDIVGPLNAFHYVEGDAASPQAECDRLGEIIKKHPIDVACVGIGKNGHLAFSDPPADFDTETAFLIVDEGSASKLQK